MQQILTICAACILPVTAFAGCASFEDRPNAAPQVRICYQDVCDLTTLIYVCSNVSDYRAEYTIGWSIRCTPDDEKPEGNCQYFWQGRPIDPAKNQFITITDLD